MSRALIPNILPHPYLHEGICVRNGQGYKASRPGCNSYHSLAMWPQREYSTSLSLREHTGNASLQGALALYSQLKCRQSLGAFRCLPCLRHQLGSRVDLGLPGEKERHLSYRQESRQREPRKRFLEEKQELPCFPKGLKQGNLWSALEDMGRRF